MSESPALYALIVGIDKWIAPMLPELQGCAHDVRLMKQVFRDRFAVPEENLLTLIDEQATRQGITEAFQHHLIDRARQWKESGSTQPSPAFVFHFSGHGSRARDRSGTQPDGLDETIVPHDSRVGDVYDIKDWELARWLQQLTRYTDNVTIILDCCHSGSGTRNADSIGTARTCQMDLRRQPHCRSDQLHGGPGMTGRAIGTRAGDDTLADDGAGALADDGAGALADGGVGADADRYVLLAACRNYEFAEEYIVRRHLSPTGQRYKHGAFTWFLANELMRLPTGVTQTYRDLFERVRYNVHQNYPTQMPQCEGDRDRILFGGARVADRFLLSVVQIDQDDYWVDAGLVHGVGIDSRLVVYPPQTRSLSADTEPLTELVVVEAEPVRCRCRRTETVEIPLHSRIAIVSAFTAPHQKKLRLSFFHQSLALQWRRRLDRPDLQPYLECIADNHAYDLILVQQGHQIQLRDSSGRILVHPYTATDIDRAAHDLISLCRYRGVLELQNENLVDPMRGQIAVELFLSDGRKRSGNMSSDQRIVRDVQPIPKTDEGIPIVELGQAVAIKITNQSDRPLYCEAISLGYDFAIQPLTAPVTKNGPKKRVEPAGAMWLGRDLSDFPIRFVLPKHVDAQQFTAATEYLKVIATVDETDYEITRQDGLHVPATTRSANPLPSIDQWLRGRFGSRALGVETDDVADFVWTTTQLEYVITRSEQELIQPITGGIAVGLPNHAIDIQAPDGFVGQARVITELTPNRSTSSGGSVRPSTPCFESHWIRPLPLLPRPPQSASSQSLASESSDTHSRLQHRAVAPAGDGLLISADSICFGLIDHDRPLKLILNGDPSPSPCMAIVWDGCCSYPVGISSDDGLDLTWMPCPIEPAGEILADAGPSRSLFRSVRLYLYELYGYSSPELGLHEATFLPAVDPHPEPLKPRERCVNVPGGQVRMRKPDGNVTGPGFRCALIIHGFSGDGATAMADLSAQIGTLLDQYHCVLTFDYESFKTPISKNGSALSDALRAIGFGPNDETQLDVIADGMGALVARSMIEQHGGQRFVDRCVLIGPPNRGSALLKLSKSLPWLGIALVNAAGPGPIATFLSAAIKKIDTDAVAIGDLKPNSPFLRGLNDGAKRRSIPYHILAGHFDATAQSGSAWFIAASRAAEFGLHTFFGDQHDLVVDSASMTDHGGPIVDCQPVDAHHFEYFQNPNVASWLLRWLH